jgi:hypothetical protein
MRWGVCVCKAWYEAKTKVTLLAAHEKAQQMGLALIGSVG